MGETARKHARCPHPGRRGVRSRGLGRSALRVTGTRVVAPRSSRGTSHPLLGLLLRPHALAHQGPRLPLHALDRGPWSIDHRPSTVPGRHSSWREQSPSKFLALPNLFARLAHFG